MKIELKADWAANHQGIHFDGTFIADGKRSPYTSGMYAWNPTMKQLVFLYTDNEGSLSEGSITNENGVIVHDFTVAEANGTISKIQARITFESSNVFTNEIFKSKEGKWEKFVSVRYERAP